MMTKEQQDAMHDELTEITKGVSAVLKSLPPDLAHATACTMIVALITAQGITAGALAKHDMVEAQECIAQTMGMVKDVLAMPLAAQRDKRKAATN